MGGAVKKVLGGKRGGDKSPGNPREERGTTGKITPPQE